MDEGEGGVGDADNFFTLYLSVNNNRSGPSSSHGPSCLRWWTTLLSSSNRSKCGSCNIKTRRPDTQGRDRVWQRAAPPFKSPPCRWFRGETTPNLGGNRFRERYFSFALLSAVRSPCPLRRVPRAKPRERESRANQSGRTIYVARPVNPRQREREGRAIKLPI